MRILTFHAKATVTLETRDVRTMVNTRGGGEGADSQYIQREFEVLMVRRSVLIGRDGAGIMADDHREPLADPLRRGDPHDWCRALDLDYPELELSQELALADICEGRIHRLFDHRPRSAVSKAQEKGAKGLVSVGTFDIIGLNRAHGGPPGTPGYQLMDCDGR